MHKKITKSVLNAVKGADSAVTNVEHEVESIIEPIQKTAFTRFPILFTLMVTFGVVTTLLGFERLVADIAYLDERPVLMLSIGLGVLMVTGTLYKKLG